MFLASHLPSAKDKIMFSRLSLMNWVKKGILSAHTTSFDWAHTLASPTAPAKCRSLICHVHREHRAPATELWGRSLWRVCSLVGLAKQFIARLFLFFFKGQNFCIIIKCYLSCKRKHRRFHLQTRFYISHLWGRSTLVRCFARTSNRKISVSVLITNEATLKLIQRVNTTGADNHNNTTNSYPASSFDCLIKTPSTSTLSCQSNACYPASPSHLLFQRHLNTSIHLLPLWLYWGFFLFTTHNFSQPIRKSSKGKWIEERYKSIRRFVTFAVFFLHSPSCQSEL